MSTTLRPQPTREPLDRLSPLAQAKRELEAQLERAMADGYWGNVVLEVSFENGRPARSKVHSDRMFKGG